jgi:hypothetical protein
MDKDGGLINPKECYSPKFHICAYKTLAHPFAYFAKNIVEASF